MPKNNESITPCQEAPINELDDKLLEEFKNEILEQFADTLKDFS